MTSPEAERSPGGDQAERGTELRTFLIADIRGYTTYTAEAGDAAAARLVRRFSALVREVVEAREGQLLELRGDEALVVFVSARQALRAATELQRRLGDEELPRGVGIGLDAGEAVPVDDGYRGTSLNVAARLCGRAGPGEVLASETVVRLASKVEGIDYVDPRTLRLKGLDQPVRVFAVVRSDQPARRRRPRPSLAGLDRRLVAAAGAAGLVAMVGAVALLTGLAGGPGASPRPSSGQPASPTPGPPTAPGAADIEPADLPVLAWIDPSTHGIVGTLEEPAAGADAAYIDGSFWVLDPGIARDRARSTSWMGRVASSRPSRSHSTCGPGRSATVGCTSPSPSPSSTSSTSARDARSPRSSSAGSPSAAPRSAVSSIASRSGTSRSARIPSGWPAAGPAM